MYRAEPTAKDDSGQKLAGNEPWRSNKSLGSLLCTEKDIARRRILAHAAFSKFKKVWLTGKKISLDRKLRLYDAQVVSVLLYNCNSWSPYKSTLEKIETLHRRHLRTILNIKGWPNGQISNKTLYKRCSVEKLSDRIERQRWNMFGHILRCSENTPAQLALFFAVESEENELFRGRWGRPRLNLFNVLVSDLGKRNLSIDTVDELYEIRDFAECRRCWSNLYGYRL